MNSHHEHHHHSKGAQGHHGHAHNAPAAAPQPDAPVAPGTEYTCPMHPEVVRPGPGACPICGMALEPKMPTLATGPDPELVDMTRRFWIAVALTVPLFVIA